MIMLPMLFGMELVVPGLDFIDESLDCITQESDFLQYVEDRISYCSWEDEVLLFNNFVRGSGLLYSVERLYKDDVPSAITATVGLLKYPFVFQRLLAFHAGVDSTNVWGLPYLIESENDLDCSLLLIRTGHYKQAVQLLRSALEAAVAHAYLSTAGVQYDDLCHQIIPPLKDRKRGMLNRLVAVRRLEASVATVISRLYSELSSAMHSQYKYLTVKFEETIETEDFIDALTIYSSVSRCCTCILLSMEGIEQYTDPAGNGPA
jgi:hypothetical protein